MEKSLKKLAQKLDKNGYLFISVPIKDSLAGKIFHAIDKDPSHASVLSRNELFNILEKLGLKILEKRYFLNLGLFKLKGIPVDIELVLKK